jgi:hypothetical protein
MDKPTATLSIAKSQFHKITGTQFFASRVKPTILGGFVEQVQEYLSSQLEYNNSNLVLLFWHASSSVAVL